MELSKYLQFFLIYLLIRSNLSSVLLQKRILLEERNDSAKVLNNLHSKYRTLSGINSEIENFKDHVNSKMRSLFLFVDKLQELKTKDLSNQRQIGMLKEEKIKVKKAERRMLEQALLENKLKK